MVVVCMMTFSSIAQIASHDALILSRYLRHDQISKDNFLTKQETALKEERSELEKLDPQKITALESERVGNRIGKIGAMLEQIDHAKGDSILSILELYFPGIKNSGSTDLINTRLQENHFFKNFTYSGEPKGFVEKKQLSISSLASSVGGLDVTNLAYGFADFLVKRTKEELNVAFFSRLKETLNKPKYADLRTLFPNTWELLDAIGSEIYDYNKYLQNLREAFLSDLITLDGNLPGIIPNHEEFFNKHFGLAVSLNTACYITSSLKYQVHPGDIIDQYPLDDFFIKKGETEYFNRNWSGAVQTLQLISESLRESDGGGENYWVSFQKVKELVGNEETFRIYLGLIYQVAKNQRYDSIKFEKGSLIALLNKVNFDSNHSAYKSYISNFAMKANDLNEKIKRYAKPANDSVAVENYALYFKSSVSLIEYCTKVTDLPDFDKVIKTDLHKELKNYFKITYEIADLVTDINRKNYSSAVNHAVTVYNLVRTKPLETEFKRITRSVDSLEKLPKESLKTMEKSLKMSRDTLQQAGASFSLSKDLLQKFVMYGTFMSNVATAKSPAEVEKAIEAAALPSGSSRIKRETSFNVALNAYTGLFIGYEQITGLDSKRFEINNFGVAAPIGVSVSTGGHSFLCLFPKNEGHWSYSAFISLVDLGAVASFRFQNGDSIAQAPKIQLKDIFSPGLFFSLGFPKSPLSLNLGAQVGPNLRNVNVKDENGDMVNKYQDNVYWRFSASLVVDIPIFNFYTRSKK